jgi:cell division transport system permease protein
MSSVSGIDGAIDPQRPEGLVAEKRGGGRPAFLRRFGRAPLLPEAGSGGAPLTAVIAVISSLASLALAAFILIAIASNAWTSELRSSLTVQIKGIDREEIKTNLAAAVKILDDAPYVADYRVIDSAEAGKLLEPWLGKGNAASLNVPALIELRLAQPDEGEISDLSKRFRNAASGIILDDHGGWNDRLAGAAKSGQALAFAVFVLIMGAACAISIFAARAGLSANADVVSLLHLVGATDDFIANQVQRRFTIIGLRGSAIGLIIALFLLSLFALATKARGADGFLLPGLTFGPGLALPLLSVPIAICLVTAIAARMTVLRTLRETY